MYTRIKTPQEIEDMRTSGRILATVLHTLKPHVQPGITTKALSDIAAKEVKALGAKSAFLGYNGFPEAICISVNDEVVHGIPKKTELKDGDVVSLDFGVSFNGMITDSAITVVCGNTGNQRVKDLIKYTEASLYDGLSMVKDGCHVGDIGHAIGKTLDKHRFGIVKDLVGHGVGHDVHEDPNIPNYGRKGTGPKLQAGMTVAIEPMATLGSHEVGVDADGWTVRSRDGSLAAHFEHTVLVTPDGFEILTQA